MFGAEFQFGWKLKAGVVALFHLCVCECVCVCRTFPFLSLLLLWGFHFGDPAFWPLRGLMLLFFFPPPLPLLTSPLGFTMFVYLIHRLGTNTSTLRPLPPDALIPRLFQIENGLQGLSRKSLCLNLYEWEPCEPFL